MIQFLIRDRAQAAGIKNAAQLAAKAGLNLNVAYRLWSEDFARIDSESLDKLCAALQCEAGDIVKYSVRDTRAATN